MRTSVNALHASTIAATIHARRGPLERRRVAADHVTSARQRSGTEKKYTIIPIPAFSMEGSTTRFVAITAITITTRALTRSNHCARLKNSHHTAITTESKAAAIIP